MSSRVARLPLIQHHPQDAVVGVASRSDAHSERQRAANLNNRGEPAIDDYERCRLHAIDRLFSSISSGHRGSTPLRGSPTSRPGGLAARQNQPNCFSRVLSVLRNLVYSCFCRLNAELGVLLLICLSSLFNTKKLANFRAKIVKKSSLFIHVFFFLLLFTRIKPPVFSCASPPSLFAASTAAHRWTRVEDAEILFQAAWMAAVAARRADDENSGRCLVTNRANGAAARATRLTKIAAIVAAAYCRRFAVTICAFNDA